LHLTQIRFHTARLLVYNVFCVREQGGTGGRPLLDTANLRVDDGERRLPCKTSRQ